MRVSLTDLLGASASGMRAQTQRMRIITENIANAATTGLTPGADPYRRQIPTFDAALDRATGLKVIKGVQAVPDMGNFPTRFDPSHPAANAEGVVKMPNVRTLMEMMDFREAQRSYEANMTLIESSRTMIRQTIDLLRV